MPLKRAADAPIEDLNRVKFAMKDVGSGAPVSCTVSEDALRKLSGGGSSITSLAAMFKKHRADIEKLANDKYERGDTSPHVCEADI